MEAIDHLDLVVSDDLDGIKLEMLHRPRERDLVRRVKELERRIAELEGG